MFLSLSVSRNLHVFTSHVRSSKEDSKAGVCVQEENKDKAAKATHTNKKGEGWEIRHVTPRDVSLDGGVTLEEERDSCGWSPTSRAPAAFPPSKRIRGCAFASTLLAWNLVGRRGRLSKEAHILRAL